MRSVWRSEVRAAAPGSGEAASSAASGRAGSGGPFPRRGGLGWVGRLGSGLAASRGSSPGRRVVLSLCLSAGRAVSVSPPLRPRSLAVLPRRLRGGEHGPAAWLLGLLPSSAFSLPPPAAPTPPLGLASRFQLRLRAAGNLPHHRLRGGLRYRPGRFVLHGRVCESRSPGGSVQSSNRKKEASRNYSEPSGTGGQRGSLSVGSGPMAPKVWDPVS